ncbi:solute carrier family 13 member 2-like [Amblyomma americanum]
MSSLCAVVAVGFPKELGNPMLADSPASWRLVLRCLPWDLILVRLGGSALQLVAKRSSASSWLLETALVDRIKPEVRPELCLIALLATTAVVAELDTADIDSHLIRSLLFLAERFERHPLYFVLPVVMQSRYVLLMPYTRPSLIFLRLHCNVRSAQLLWLGILIKVASSVGFVIAANTLLVV